MLSATENLPLAANLQVCHVWPRKPIPAQHEGFETVLKAKGTTNVLALRESVWRRLHEAEIWRAALPACENVEGTAERGMTAEFQYQLGPIPLSLACRAAFQTRVMGSSLGVTVSGINSLTKGAECHLDIKLEPNGVETRIDYEVAAEMNSGLLNAVGDGLSSQVNRIAAKFFDRLKASIEAGPGN